MRVLVCLYTMEIGGSQINAIEIGAAVSKRGHEVIIYGPDGELRDMVRELDLEFVQAPSRDSPRLSIRHMRALADTVRCRRVDLVHAYEAAPILDAAYGTHLWRATPLVGTVMSMSVSKYLPTHLPLIVGTAEIAEGERPRRRSVDLLEPPVDTKANAPAADSTAARAQLDIADSDIAVVVVSRLVPSLKQEGILAAVAAVRMIGGEHPDVRLVVVGDGPSRESIRRAAVQTNAILGRQAVTLAGQMFDPRAAYAAADIVLGMGGSALRALAFAKPVVVQGERGFWELATPQSLDIFLRQGWYGIGDGSDGAPRLASILADLAAAPERRRALGEFGREVVTTYFSLEQAAKRQVEIYEGALRTRQSASRRFMAMCETSVHYAWFRARWLRQVAGRFRRGRPVSGT
ncbi:Glycosyltransferase involved in cell wall bisynthesis [Micromonospora phaseoli]|uniref:Glycosyltransferase involved in cell wall bisynthesis n=1 Tax=Micromonospora phaseoli TaxID=1144548 RepID=A0A1H6T190_9ACTN|nr:glycosyltransferase family 4 protein [Micromonospora phaseoli]PZW04192.1 glycosyltransferase involved in cell wall biosynthesis [Micromonospora phaseoli]GIJ79379.1 glycosyl transferase family 1 [Micromonospora phaseoli]SEI73889.1 Glycosyltransferase involved in cell wall bisynthesis [Micromonospora phaseoli]